MTEPQRIAEAPFLDAGYSCRVPPHVQKAIARLRLARQQLGFVREYETLGRLECQDIAGKIERAIADLEGANG